MQEETSGKKTSNSKGLDLTSLLMLAFVVILPFGFFFITKYFPQKHKSQYGLLQSILLGNKRFAQGHPQHPNINVQYLETIAKEQHPTAIVITCSDSRVSPELIFDKGLGEMFVIRTAGNIIGEIELGSVEYAVEHLGVSLVMVLGHERCGAIKALVDHELPNGHLKTIIDSLEGEPEIQSIPESDPNRLDDCIVANVNHGLKELMMQSPIVAERVKNGKLKLIGARYDLDDHIVSIVKK